MQHLNGKVAYIKFLLLFELIILSPRVIQAASDCTALIPRDGAYDIFRSWSASDFQLAIDEYVYHKEFQTHDEALAAGFSLGTIIYGVPLKAGGTFS